jgi:hypothetical protein
MFKGSELFWTTDMTANKEKPTYLQLCSHRKPYITVTCQRSSRHIVQQQKIEGGIKDSPTFSRHHDHDNPSLQPQVQGGRFPGRWLCQDHPPWSASPFSPEPRAGQFLKSVTTEPSEIMCKQLKRSLTVGCTIKHKIKMWPLTLVAWWKK